MNSPPFTASPPQKSAALSFEKTENWPVRGLILVGMVFMGVFVWVYAQPANRGHAGLFALLTVSVLFKLLRLLHEWYHYWNVAPPVPPPVTRRWRVDILTTFCPGEPRAMLLNTLEAIEAITYPHTTYLCDEADDPYLRNVCQKMGIRHVTRSDKKDAKAGNINNALLEASGEICLVLDPDHVPVPDFLDQVLPYFEQADVGFVQCVQAYSNGKESLVAFGAGEQTYTFYGPMMRGMSNYGTAQAIGANCTFRRAALDDIGGHAAGLSEDMHTAMQLHARGWQSVYVPLPLSYGLVPATLSAYYKQQLKWARGTFELLLMVLPGLFTRLMGRQRIHYLTLPLYYLLGVVQLIDLTIPILALVWMRLPLQLDLLLFATAYLPLAGTAFLIRQYAQRWLSDQHEAGFHFLGGILSSGTWWVYVLGFVYTIFRVPVPYLPTPKNDQPRNHVGLCMPNLLGSLITLAAIGYSIYHYGRFAFSNVYSQMIIGFGVLNVLILGMNVLIGQEKLLWNLKAKAQRIGDKQPVAGSARRAFWKVRYGLYGWLRGAALPLLGVVLVATIALIYYPHQYRTRQLLPPDLRRATTQRFYYGNDDVVRPLQSGAEVRIAPQHLTWTAGADLAKPNWPGLPHQLPLLYLEPQWPGPARGRSSEAEIRAFLVQLLTGKHDATLRKLIGEVKAYQRPLLLCFAPGFDDATRPWGTQRSSTLALYQRGYTYLVDFCRQQRVGNVTWIWAFTKPTTLVFFHADPQDIDWLGVNIGGRSPEAAAPPTRSLAAAYQLMHKTIRLHASYVMQKKPVLITRDGAKTGGPSARQWERDAMEVIEDRYPEVRGLVYQDQSRQKL